MTTSSFHHLATLLHEHIMTIQARSHGDEKDDDKVLGGERSTEIQDRASRRIMRRLDGQLQAYKERPEWAEEEMAARMNAALRIAVESLHPGLCDTVGDDVADAPLCTSIIQKVCRM